MMQDDRKIPIAEIFGPTVQGEGGLIGQRTMFIRTAYCDGAGEGGWCKWCDSMPAVNPIYKPLWRQMTAREIVEEVLDTLDAGNRRVRHVTISGGNPVIHNLTTLVYLLRCEQFKVNIETQGTIWKDWLVGVDTLTVSPKPPSSGSDSTASFQFFWHNIDVWGMRNKVVLKLVVDPESVADCDWATNMLMTYRRRMDDDNIYWSCLTRPTDTTADIIERTMKLTQFALDQDIGDVRVLPQYHKLLWGHKSGV